MTPEQLAARLWPERELELEPLPGGITNQNFKVTVDGVTSVLRIGGKDSELLAIDRSVEHGASLVAAELGIGPEVVDFVEPEGYLVTRFVDGRPIPPEEMRRPETVRRAAAVLRRLHDGPPIPGRFDSFRVVEVYAETAAAHGVSVPDVFEWAHGVALRIEATRGGPVPVPCHNDYQNLNFLDVDGDIRIVDWEYAGMGDRFFDLANFSINHEFDDDANAALLEAYFGALSGRGCAGAPAHALHVRFPRGDVGRRPAGRLGARRRLRRLGLPALRPDAADGRGSRVRAGTPGRLAAQTIQTQPSQYPSTWRVGKRRNASSSSSGCRVMRAGR